MTQEESQLDLLAVFHFVVGGLTAFFACFPFIHVAMGVAMLSGAFDHGRDAPPREVGWVFVVLGGTFILLGWTLAVVMILAGRRLKQRRARTFCLVVAALECLLMPFGTILGVFTLVTLMKENVIRLFAARNVPVALPPYQGG